MSEAEVPPDLELLLPSWELHLRAERKSASTVKSYTDGVRAYIDYYSTEGLAATFDRRTINAFLAPSLAVEQPGSDHSHRAMDNVSLRWDIGNYRFATRGLDLLEGT